MTTTRLCVVLLLLSITPLQAQWVNHPTPDLPRTPDGQPNLSAPAPRMADGKPDFSGVWGFDAGVQLFNIALGLRPEDIKPWAAELAKQRADAPLVNDQIGTCLPEGPRFNHWLAYPKKIIQTPRVLVILGEDLTYRQIFLDGRALPAVTTPSFMGYSVGHWEGDTLVVETIGYKDATRLDWIGHPHTENLRLTERWRRRDFGHIEIQETLEDPDIYSRPLSVTVKVTLVPDTELLEYVCVENEKDRAQLVGTVSQDMKAAKPVKVAPAILEQYVGTYDFRWPENPAVSSPWPVTIANGDLLMFGVPMVPLSETKFLWAATANPIEFVKDAQGHVTHAIFTSVEGDTVVKKLK
jgi:hypothetical protein